MREIDIQLKLAARRYKAFGDVVALIGANNLDESFLPQVHPSVHQGFIECLEEKRRKDETRQDAEVQKLLDGENASSPPGS